jgi:hypothetical protein
MLPCSKLSSSHTLPSKGLGESLSRFKNGAGLMIGCHGCKAVRQPATKCMHCKRACCQWLSITVCTLL